MIEVKVINKINFICDILSEIKNINLSKFYLKDPCLYYFES